MDAATFEVIAPNKDLNIPVAGLTWNGQLMLFHDDRRTAPVEA